MCVFLCVSSYTYGTTTILPKYSFSWQCKDILTGPYNFKGPLEGQDLFLRLGLEFGSGYGLG